MPRTTPPVGFVPPMLPSVVDQAPEGDEWIHEIRFDGYRTELTIAGRDVHALRPASAAPFIGITWHK